MFVKQDSLASNLCQSGVICFAAVDSTCSIGNVQQMAKESVSNPDAIPGISGCAMTMGIWSPEEIPIVFRFYGQNVLPR
jgi:Na+/H+ antiporter NhaC